MTSEIVGVQAIFECFFFFFFFFSTGFNDKIKVREDKTKRTSYSCVI